MTRQEVARFVAAHLVDGREEAVEQAAAWLVESGRGREAAYLATDVAASVADEGYLFARATTAHELSARSRAGVEKHLSSLSGARHIELVCVVDPSVMGGIRLETPVAALDNTIQRKLTQIAEGASL